MLEVIFEEGSLYIECTEYNDYKGMLVCNNAKVVKIDLMDKDAQLKYSIINGSIFMFEKHLDFVELKQLVKL